MIIIIFLIAGLIIGSFLNVLAMRLHDAEDLFFSRSKCPRCKKLIHWYDNIPVLSFILLKFRCRDCKKPISWIYPTVEIFTGIVFALVGWHFFQLENLETWLPTLFYLFISSVLIAILVYDWLYMEISSALLWTAIFGAVAFNLWADFNGQALFPSGNSFSIFEIRTYSGTLAAFSAFVIFFSLSAFSREKWMGMGDAYLVILLGAVLGWPEIFLALFLAFFFGAAYGTITIMRKKKKLKSQVPFAPFLVAGTFVTLFFYEPIINWYYSIFL